MRLMHVTLQGLSRSEFLAAMYEALDSVQDAGPDESEDDRGAPIVGDQHP
jgi:hypothetical protein